MSQGFLPTEGSRSGSPTFGSFFQRRRGTGSLGAPERQTYASLLGMTEGSIAEALGAPGGTVRKIQAQPEYDVAQAAEQAIPGVGTEPNKGVVASLFDFLGRGSSAGVGAVTGLLGMSRPETGEREADAANRNNINTAIRRAMEGISGEDQFRFAEFTSVANKKARGEEVGLIERGFNSALGFVIDTAVDPLTYISFGGSILGRLGASRKVASATRSVLKGALGRPTFDARRFISEMVQDNVVKSDAVARIMRRDMDELFSNKEFLNRVIDGKDKDWIRNFNKWRKQAFDQTDELGSVLQDADMLRQYVGFDISRDVALQLAPEAAALNYARRSAAGLRAWARKSFGDDFGEAYVASLPKDIQGGLRIRAPFVRNADGTAKAWGVQGVGAGRLGEKYKAIRKATELTERGRDYLRAGLAPVLGKITGKNADIYYDAIVAATGRTIPYGAGRSAASYLDYSVAEAAQFQARQADALFERKIYERHTTANNLYISGRQEYGDQFHEQWKNYFYSTQKLKEALEQRDSLTEMQQRALDSAAIWRDMLDEIGNEAVSVYNRDYTSAFNFLQDYAPRITTGREAARRARKGRMFVTTGTTSDFSKTRSRFASGWAQKKNGDIVRVGWEPPENILTMGDEGWDEVFKADPTQFMADYLIDTKMALNEQRLINLFVDSGVIARPRAKDIASLRRVNESIVGEEIVEALGIDQPGWLKILEEELKTKFVPRAAASRQTLREAEAIADRIAAAGIEVTRRVDLDEYTQGKGGSFVNKWDGTTIRNKKGTSEWELLDAKGNPVLNKDGSPVVFGSYQDAKVSAATIFRSKRTAAYKTAIADEREKILEEIAGTERTFGSVYQGWLRMVDNVPPQDQPATIQALVEIGLRQMQKFGRLKPGADVSASGRPYIRKGDKVAAVTDKDLAKGFRDWLTAQNYMNIEGMSFNPDGTIAKDSVERVKDRVSLQMQQMYGSEKLMESLQRMFSVYQEPKSEVARMIKNLYMPFYAMQKAWMTLGRGPGFVARNILGGSWNLHITGVGRVHTSASAALLTAQVKARRIVKEKLGDTIFEREPLTVGNMMRDEVSKIIRGQYAGKTGNFIKGVEDGDALIELWELFHKNGLGGNRNTSRFVGEILGFSSQTGRAGTLKNERLDPNTGKVITEYFEPNMGSTGAPTTVVASGDIGLYEKWMNKAAFDNPWIRNVMAPMAESSEEYLRMAAFLKGAQEMGLEDAASGIRGYGASQWVKASQFDYSDLSDFERNGLKLLLPFYTWTRYNVPLQVRAAIHQPGLIQQALRIHESLGDMFQDDDENPVPSYVADRFGFQIDENSAIFEMLPEWMRPQGDVAMGMFLAEPLTDLNTWLRIPGEGVSKFNPLNYLNIREFGQNLNPIAKMGAEIMKGMEGEPAISEMPTEPAPGWTQLPGFKQVLSRIDPSTGERVVNRSAMIALRSALPQVGMIERYAAPVAGGERDPGRWLTAIVSGVLGLPVSTLDDWKTAGEMNRRTEFVKRQLESKFGEDYEYKMEMIRALVKDGATPEFIANLDIVGMGSEEVDVRKAVSAWRMFRRIETLIASGTAEEEIVAALSAYAPEGSPQLDLIQTIWRYVPPADSDAERGIRQFGVQTLEEDELQSLGFLPEDVRRMDADERARILWEYSQRGR